ncbi:MAG: carbohydrate porin, partial [Planctomycetes bacterium]|nr:carbohydrate porin [Planctomycetota bacterium]
MYRRLLSTWTIRLALLALLAIATTATAADDCDADECDCDDEACWLATTPNLTGNWWGLRPCLAESGVTFQADSTDFYFGNTAGGVNQDFDFAGHGDYTMLFDCGKLGIQEGLFLKVKAEHRYGETIGDDVGSFFSPTIAAVLPVAGSERLYITNVLLTQMLSETVGVFAGKMDTLDGDMNAFAHGRGKTQFSNLGFVFNPITAATVPYSTLGAGCFILQEGQQLASFSVMNSQDTTGTSGFGELFEDGVLIAANVRVPTRFLDRPGHQLLGGTWNNRTYNSIGDAYAQYPNIIIPTERGSWSLFWNCDQYLVVDSEDPLRGWGVFGRAGVADDGTNPLGWFLSFGLGGNSPIACRPADTFGIGWYYSGSSSQIGDILTAVAGPIGNGQAVELFYNYELT